MLRRMGALLCAPCQLFFWVFEMICDTAYNDPDASGNIASIRVRALPETVGRVRSQVLSLSGV